MNPGQDKITKAFFTDQWHQPLRRLGKMLTPILLASTIIIVMLFSFYYYGPRLAPLLMNVLHQPININFFQSLELSILAVILGICVVLIGHYLVRQHQSRFSLVRLRVLRKRVNH